jgi:putative flavoprotein involved in K+ transport
MFTPSTHDGLPGMPFPGQYRFPSGAEMAGYLASYADRFALPVRTGVHVDGLFRDGDHYLLTSGADAYSADNVVLATGPHRTPRVPKHAAELSPTIRQLHAAEYRNPGQLRAGPVLVVGAGNSGADIALEVCATHPVLLAGRHPGHLPIRIEGRVARFLFPLFWFGWNHILTLHTPWGRRLRANLLERGEGLVRIQPQDIDAAGIERTARIESVADGRPVTADGRALDASNVIWATGFRPDFGWINLPDLDTSGDLAHDRGVVTGQPGLYVVGQHFQYSYGSDTAGGVGRDAAFVVQDIARRTIAGGHPEAQEAVAS